MVDIGNNRNRFTLTLSWIVVFLWMALIFFSSAQVADQSNELSRGITKTIIEVVEKVSSGLSLDISLLNYLLRKSTHFFAYFVLGILVLHALKKNKVNGFSALVLAFGICALYAVSDEVHQLFVPGRGGKVTDVLIDSSGAIVGIVLYVVMRKNRA